MQEDRTVLIRHAGGIALRFLCETPEELERTMHGKRIWWEEIKTLWWGSKHLENTAKAV